jgi:integrase/recombinase XerD
MTNSTVEKYKNALLGDKKSENTVREYLNIVENFLAYIQKDPEKVTSADIEKYKVYLAVEKYYSKNSIYTAIKAIQSFYRYLRLDTAINISVPRRPKQNPKYLTLSETTRLLEAARQDLRDYAILILLAYTGLRVNELCNLKISDIDFAEKVIHVLSGKGDKDRIVIMEDKTLEALKNYILVRMPVKDYLFTSQKKTKISSTHVERLVRTYALKCGITKKVTPHVLRHTFATTLLRNGADIRFIQQILGHASLATTQIYTHVDDQSLKYAYEKAKPSY